MMIKPKKNFLKFKKPQSYYVVKNSFKSVLRNKIQMIGLILLIFLTSIIFTLLYTTTQRIDNAYNSFVTNSNLHHVIVDLREQKPKPDQVTDLEKTNLIEDTAYFQWVLTKIKEENQKNNAFDFEYRETRMISKIGNNRVDLFKTIAYDNKSKIDKLVLSSGRMINKINEIIVAPEYARKNNYQLGDYLCLQSKECDANNEVNNPLKIVGLGTSADYMFPQLDMTTPIAKQDRETIIFVHPEQFGLFATYRNNYELKAKGVNWEYVKSREKLTLTSKVDREIYFIIKWKNKARIDINGLQAQLENYFLNNGSKKFVFATEDLRYDFSSRVNTLQKILNAYRITAISLLLMVLIISGFIIALVTKKRIQNSRIQIGVLKSLGISTFSLIQSFLIYPFIAAIFGGTLGYIVGILLQIPIINIFNWYFTIPLGDFSFNLWSLLFSISGIFLLLGTITILASFWYVKGSPLKMLHPLENSSTNFLTKWVNHLNRGKKFTVRFRWAIFSRSIAKMLTVIITMFSATILLTFSITGPKALQNMRQATYRGINYQAVTEYETPIWNSVLSYYAVYNPEFKNNQQGVSSELYSPRLINKDGTDYSPNTTMITGLANLNYRLFDLDFYLNSILTKFESAPIFTFIKEIVCKQAISDWDEMSFKDSYSFSDCIIKGTTQKAPYFVRNRLKNLEYSLKLIEVDIARKVLVAKDLVKKDPNLAKENQAYLDQISQNNIDWNDPKKYEVIKTIFEKIKTILNKNNAYMAIIDNHIKASAQQLNLQRLFNIQFGLVSYNPEVDELATMFKPIINKIHRNGNTYTNNKTINIKAYGIEKNSRMHHLWDNNNNNLLEIMYENYKKIENSNNTDEKVIPIIINQTIAKHLQIDKGDILEINSQRKSLYKKDEAEALELDKWDIDGFANTTHESISDNPLYDSVDEVSEMYKKVTSGAVYIKMDQEPPVKMKVIGIQEGYGDPRMFVAKNAVDVILGYIEKGKTWENSKNYKKIEKIFATVTGFEDETYKTDDNFRKQFGTMTYSEAVKAMFPTFNTKFSINKDITDIVNSISVTQLYGDFTQISLNGKTEKKGTVFIQSAIGLGQGAVNFAMPIATHQSIFDEIKGIADAIFWAFMAVSLLISFVTILITSNIIITENKRLIATMKVIGYGDLKINGLTLGMYLPVILLAFGIGFPIAWWIMKSLVDYLAINSTWIMPFYFSAGLIFLVLAIILIIYGITFLIGWFALKRVNPIQALKVND